MLEQCPNCFGEGMEPGEFDEEPCPECRGEGRHEEVRCDLCRGEGCPRCDHMGKLYDVECPACRGRGEIEVPVKCSVCKGWKTVLPETLFKEEES